MPASLPLTDMISQTSTASYKNKVRRTQFGDGYVQAVSDGINPTLGQWSITYENLDLSERTTLFSVLNTVGSWDYLSWQSPMDSSPKKWQVSEEGVSVQAKSGELYTVSFMLKQIP